MAQNIKDNDISETGVNVDNPLKNTHNEGEKSNKCNQYSYASSRAGSLRTHLRMHRGEKSNKCNQCDFASSYASALKKHFKAHGPENSNK